MNSFQFFETHWEIKLDIGSCISVMCQFDMIVLTVILIAQAQFFMPVQARCFPVIVPLHFFTRTHKKLHFHLFELAHTEDKLARYDLVPERFSDLSNSKRNLHAARFLNIQEVHKNTLSRFRTQVNRRSIAGNGSGYFCELPE